MVKFESQQTYYSSDQVDYKLGYIIKFNNVDSLCSSDI